MAKKKNEFQTDNDDFFSLRAFDDEDAGQFRDEKHTSGDDNYVSDSVPDYSDEDSQAKPIPRSNKLDAIPSVLAPERSVPQAMPKFEPAPNDDAYLESEKAWEAPGHQGLENEDRIRLEDRRVRRRYLIAYVALILACAAVVWAVWFMAGKQPAPSEPYRFGELNDMFAVPSRVPSAVIPNLVELEGKTSTEDLEALGSKASLDTVSVNEITTSTTTNGIDGAIGDDGVITIDGTVEYPSVAVEREALIRFAPEDNVTTSEYNSANLRLIEDAEEHVRDISYTVSLDDLGYSNYSFASTLEDTGYLYSILEKAGVESADIKLQQPEDLSSTQTMGTNSLGIEYVKSEAYAFSGTTGIDDVSEWSLELVYDHTAEDTMHRAGVLTRTVAIRIKPQE